VTAVTRRAHAPSPILSKRTNLGNRNEINDPRCRPGTRNCSCRAKPPRETFWRRNFLRKRHWNQYTAFTGFDPTYTCLSPGMPRIMNIYEPMEIVITPDTIHILLCPLSSSEVQQPACPQAVGKVSMR
jgi:hypothetical protein